MVLVMKSSATRKCEHAWGPENQNLLKVRVLIPNAYGLLLLQ